MLPSNFYDLTCGQTLGNVCIKKGIFQGDSLSTLIFVLCMIPLSKMLRGSKEEYEIGIEKLKINHLLFM